MLKKIILLLGLFVVIACSEKPNKDWTDLEVSDGFMRAMLTGQDSDALNYIEHADKMGAIEKSIIKSQITEGYRLYKKMFGKDIQFKVINENKTGYRVERTYLIYKGNIEINYVSLEIVSSPDGWRIKM